MGRNKRRRATASPAAVPGASRGWSRRSLIASGGVLAIGAVVSPPAHARSQFGAGPAPASGKLVSPELAVESYLDALATSDFDAALTAFAIEPYVERFDFRASLARVRTYSQFATPLPLPPTSPFNVAIDLEHRRATVGGQVLDQYFTLVNPNLDRFTTLNLADDAAVLKFVTEFEATMSPAPLADLVRREFVAFDEIDADAAAIYLDDRTVEQDTVLRAIVGADESQELAIRSSVLDRNVFLLFRVVRYGEVWAIDTLGGLFSTLAAIPATAAGTLVTSAVTDDSVSGGGPTTG